MFILAPNLLFLLAILGSGLLDPTPAATATFTVLFLVGLCRTYWSGRSIGKRLESVLAVVGIGVAYGYTYLIGEFYLYSFRYWLAGVLVIRSFRRMGKREYADCFVISAGILAHIGKNYMDLPFLWLILGNVFLLPYALFYYMAHYGGFQKTEPIETRAAPKFSFAQFRFMTGVSLALTLVIVVVFLAIPRPRGGTLLAAAGRDPSATTGFSRDMALGSFNRIVENQNVVMTVQTDTPALWRGSVLDFYSGGKWRESVQSDLSKKPAARTGAGPTIVRRFELFDMRVLGNQVFTAGDVISVSVPDARWRISDKPIYSTMFVPVTRRMPAKGAYDLVSSDSLYIGDTALRVRRATRWNSDVQKVQKIDERELFLQIPPNLSERVRNLALDLTRDKNTVEEKVRAIEQHLGRGYDYSLSNLSSGSTPPLEYFLFESKSGHCEYFASAMAMLLRCAGVPSRVVQGFAPGTEVEGQYIVRLSDAHMWCEAFYPGKGWRAHDPSPGSEDRAGVARRAGFFERMQLKWYTHVLRYDGLAQMNVLTGITAAVSSALDRCALAVSRAALPLRIGLGVALLFLVMYRLGMFRELSLPAWLLPGRGRSARRVRDYFGRYLKEIARKNYRREPGTTPNDLILALVHDRAPIVEEARFLTELFYSTRFGGRSPAADSEAQIKQALRTIREWAR